MADETLDLGIEIHNQEALDELKGKLGAVQEEVGDLVAAFGRGEIEEKDFDAAMKRLAASSKNYEAAIKAVEKALADQARAEQKAADEAARDAAAQEKAAAQAAAAHEQSVDRFIAASKKKQAAADREQEALERKRKKEEEDAEAEDEGSKAAQRLGQGFLELSRAVEDAQFGLVGVLNNIPTMIERFGGTAGLAAAISLTAVAVNQLLPKLKALWESVDQSPLGTRRFIGELEALEKQIKELEDKKVKLTVDVRDLAMAQERLDTLRKGMTEFAAQQAKQRDFEAESGKKIQEALTESETGAAGIEDKLKKQAIARDIATSATIPGAKAAQQEALVQIQEAQRTIEAPFATRAQKMAAQQKEDEAREHLHDALERQRAAVQEITTKAESEVGLLIAEAREGHGAKQAEAQARLATRLRQVGEGQVAVGIEAVSPERVRKQTEAEKDLKDLKAEREYEEGVRKKAEGERKKVEDEKKKADNAVIEALNQQGKSNEEAAKKEMDAFAKDVGATATAYKGKLKDVLEQLGADALAAGRTAEQARAEIAARARGTIEAGGADRGTAAAAAARLAEETTRDLTARVAARQAELPAAPVTPAPAPGGRRRPGRAAPAPEATPTLEQRAAVEVAGEVRAQGAKRTEAARQEGLAKQIYQRSAPMTGVQFTPDEAREAAKQSIELQKHGINVNQATVAAMRQGLQAMAALSNRLNQLGAEANQLGMGFNQVARQAQPMQHSALDWGGR